VRSSFSERGWGTIDLIRAASPHCGQAVHVAVIDGHVRTKPIIPILSHIALPAHALFDARSIVGILDAVATPRKSILI
jgi:hypothetical protein